MLKKEQNSFSLVSAHIKQRRLVRLVFERDFSDGGTACTSVLMGVQTYWLGFTLCMIRYKLYGFLCSKVNSSFAAT